jgi:tetratricopeptide (TPR) repeat protein
MDVDAAGATAQRRGGPRAATGAGVRRAIGAVVAIALGVRLVGALDVRGDPTFDSPLVDAHAYDRAAREIVAGGPGALEVPYYQPPGYVFFLAAIYGVTGGSWTAPRVAHAILGALTVGLVAGIAGGTGGRRRRAAGSPSGGGRAAVIAGGLLALYGPALYFERELLPPALLLALETGAILMLLRADASARPARETLAAGLLLGLATVVRPTALLVAAAAAIWWGRGGDRPDPAPAESGGSGPGKRRGRALALAAIALLLPILPIAATNLLRGGEPVVISWNGGINLWLGNGAGSDSLTAIQPGHAWDRLQREPLRAGVTSRRGETDYWTKRAVREAAADPIAWLGALGRKALRLLDAWERPRNTDYQAARETSRFLGLPWIGFGVLAPLALLGLIGIGPGGRGRRRSLLGWTLAAVAVENLLFFPTARYRLEAVPALAALAGLGVDDLIRSGRRALRRRTALVLAAGLVVVHVDWLGERRIDRARVAINRGVAHRRAERLAPALAAFREAARISPGDPDAERWLGEMALGAGSPDRAVAHFDVALAGAPDYLRVLLGKAQALEKLRRPDEAEAVYRRALEVDPWATETRLNYGVFLAIEGRREEAARQFDAGLRIDPTDGRLLRNRERLRSVAPETAPSHPPGSGGS